MLKAKSGKVTIAATPGYGHEACKKAIAAIQDGKAIKIATPSNYQVNVTSVMIARGYRARQDMQWELLNITTAPGNCQLCGHPIVYDYHIVNHKDGQHMHVGSECVTQINGIDPDQVLYAEMVMKRQVTDQKNKRLAEKKAARAAEYREKYCEECAFLVTLSAHEYLKPELYSLIAVLRDGTRALKPGEIEAVHKKMDEVKAKQNDGKTKLVEAVGGDIEYSRFATFVIEQAGLFPYKDFWQHALRGLSQYSLSDNMIAAIKRSMGSSDNTALIEKLGGEDDYKLFADFIKDQLASEPSNEFWQSIMAAFGRNAISDKQIEAVWRNMAKFNPDVGDKIPATDISIHCEIEVPSWLARKHIISKVMEGYILKESSQGYYFKGHAVTRPSTWCFRCGLELTHPVSLKVGYGAECCSKLGIPWTATTEEQIARMQELMRNVVFEGWLPKSKVDVIKLP